MSNKDYSGFYENKRNKLQKVSSTYYPKGLNFSNSSTLNSNEPKELNNEPKKNKNEKKMRNNKKCEKIVDIKLNLEAKEHFPNQEKLKNQEKEKVEKKKKRKNAKRKRRKNKK